MSKNEYVRNLILGKLGDMRLLEAAFIYWHSGIPLDDAKKYIANLDRKINAGR